MKILAIEMPDGSFRLFEESDGKWLYRIENFNDFEELKSFIADEEAVSKAFGPAANLSEISFQFFHLADGVYQTLR